MKDNVYYPIVVILISSVVVFLFTPFSQSYYDMAKSYPVQLVLFSILSIVLSGLVLLGIFKGKIIKLQKKVDEIKIQRDEFERALNEIQSIDGEINKMRTIVRFERDNTNNSNI